MRMWMVEPRKMCRKHLLGEHVEIHMFIGTLKKKKNIKGYIKNNLLEMSSLFKRHEELVEEMKKREMSHRTNLDKKEIKELINFYNEKERNFKIDKENSLKELILRCEECRKNFKEV